MAIIGIVLVFLAGYISTYIIKLGMFKEQLAPLLPPEISYQFVIISVIYFISFLIFYLFIFIKDKILKNDIMLIDDAFKRFESERKFKPNLKSNDLKGLIPVVNEFLEFFIEQELDFNRKITEFEARIKELEEINELQEVLLLIVNQDGKLVKTNEKAKNALNIETISKFNLYKKSAAEIFDEKLPESWLFDYVNKSVDVSINGIKFILNIKKFEGRPEFLLSLTDVTVFDEERKKLEKKLFIVSNNLYSKYKINKTYEMSMIRIVNYDKYASYLPDSILEVFDDEFAKKIHSLEYDEVFQIDRDIYAIYDFHIDFGKIKRVLEETIKISISGSYYFFNPIIVIGSGVNYTQAKEQVLESSYTMVSKVREKPKYELEFVKLVNSTINNDRVEMGYFEIEGENNTIIIKPLFDSEYGLEGADEEIMEYLKEFNLYLQVMKNLMSKNLDHLKFHKIILNVTSKELLSETLMDDLLNFINREELRVVFNVEINGDYKLILPMLKTIKLHSQLSLRKVGNSFINFKDIYGLKIEYIEIDDSLINLMRKNRNWGILLKGVKLILSGQRTKILANHYKDERVLKISNQLKQFGKEEGENSDELDFKF